MGVRAWAFMRAAASRRMKSTLRGIKPRARAGTPLHFAYTRNSRNYPLDTRHTKNTRVAPLPSEEMGENRERKACDFSRCVSIERCYDQRCFPRYFSIAVLIILSHFLIIKLLTLFLKCFY